MPHIYLELSKNVLEKDTLEPLFQACHKILAELLPTELSSCKSRSLEYASYHVGDGHARNAFVHMNVKIMPGRTHETIQKTSEALISLLKAHFARSQEALCLQLSVEIGDLMHYLK